MIPNTIVIEDEILRSFLTKVFKRWARKEKLGEEELVEAVEEIEDGLIDAELGGNLIKKRIARSGQGKSGGFRTILAYKTEEKAFFIYGFSKNEKDNISSKELKALKIVGGQLLSYSEEKLEHLLESGELFELEQGE